MTSRLSYAVLLLSALCLQACTAAQLEFLDKLATQAFQAHQARQEQATGQQGYEPDQSEQIPTEVPANFPAESPDELPPDEEMAEYEEEAEEEFAEEFAEELAEETGTGRIPPSEAVPTKTRPTKTRPTKAYPAKARPAKARPIFQLFQKPAPRRGLQPRSSRTPARRPLSKLYRHPSGVGFRHPADWQAGELAEGVVSLKPADLNLVGGGPAEAFLIFGDDAEGVTDIGKPQVVAQVRGLVAQMFPSLKPQGRPAVSTYKGRKSLALSFTGRARSIEMKARFRVFLHQGMAIGALTLTDASRFAGRDADMQRIYHSMSFAQPRGDQRLVGAWRYSKTYISGSFSSITVRNLVIKADGTCLEGGRLMASMEHADNGGNATGWSSADSGRGAEHRGRWHTEGKNIILRWSDGSSETWRVYLEGNSMLWSQGKTRKLWKRR